MYIIMSSKMCINYGGVREMQSSSVLRLMMPVVEASTVMREASSSVARLASSMAGTISRLPATSRGVIIAGAGAGAGAAGGAHCTCTVTGLPPCREYSYKYLTY